MTSFDGPYYEQLQVRLRALLAEVSSQLPEITVELVAEMIDANECGIALEMMAEMLVESDAALDDSFVRDVSELAETMGIEPGSVEALRAQVR